MLFEAKQLSDTTPRNRLKNFGFIKFMPYGPELKNIKVTGKQNVDSYQSLFLKKKDLLDCF
jgi:hypothetical protein